MLTSSDGFCRSLRCLRPPRPQIVGLWALLRAVLHGRDSDARWVRAANGKDGLHLYRVPELKIIATYLKKKLNVHVTGFSSMNKKDLVDWISNGLHRQDAGAAAGAFARLARCLDRNHPAGISSDSFPVQENVNECQGPCRPPATTTPLTYHPRSTRTQRTSSSLRLASLRTHSLKLCRHSLSKT
eukprot:3670941-Rhodomonas_salina.1